MMPDLVAALDEIKSLRAVTERLSERLRWAQKMVSILLGVVVSLTFLAGVVVVLAVRSAGEGQRVARQVDRAQSKIETNAHAQALYNWNQCQRSVTNTTKLNDATSVFIKFLESNNKPRRPAITQWINIQRGALLTVPECGPRP